MDGDVDYPDLVVFDNVAWTAYVGRLGTPQWGVVWRKVGLLSCRGLLVLWFCEEMGQCSLEEMLLIQSYRS